MCCSGTLPPETERLRLKGGGLSCPRDTRLRGGMGGTDPEGVEGGTLRWVLVRSGWGGT